MIEEHNDEVARCLKMRNVICLNIPAFHRCLLIQTDKFKKTVQALEVTFTSATKTHE